MDFQWILFQVKGCKRCLVALWNMLINQQKASTFIATCVCTPEDELCQDHLTVDVSLASTTCCDHWTTSKSVEGANCKDCQHLAQPSNLSSPVFAFHAWLNYFFLKWIVSSFRVIPIRTNESIAFPTNYIPKCNSQHWGLQWMIHDDPLVDPLLDSSRSVSFHAWNPIKWPWCVVDRAAERCIKMLDATRQVGASIQPGTSALPLKNWHWYDIQ